MDSGGSTGIVTSFAAGPGFESLMAHKNDPLTSGNSGEGSSFCVWSQVSSIFLPAK